MILCSLPHFDTKSIVYYASTVNTKKYQHRQVKAARALLAWSQERLAIAADVSIPTIKRLEAQDGRLGGRGRDSNPRFGSALETAGVEFIDENGGGPGVRLRRPLKVKTHK